MQASPRLGVDLGRCATVAVLCWPGGRWQPVLFDGAPHLPSAVGVGADGTLVTGAAAAQRAVSDPGCVEPEPVGRLREGRITLGSVSVEAVDLVAAVLGRVRDAAVDLVGGPAGEVSVVTPAGWGPRRRMLLRQASRRAGLGEVMLAEAPVAAADRLTAAGNGVPVGSWLVVCDVGAQVEASVVRRTVAGFEVVSTVDADGGGGRVDAALAAHVVEAATGGRPDGAGGGAERPEVLAAVRLAKETLSGSDAVAVSLPAPYPPVVVSAATLQQLAAPVLDTAGSAVRQAVEAAQLPTDRCVGMVVVGAGAQLPGLVERLSAAAGVPARLVESPKLAAVLGAVGADTPATDSDAATSEVPVSASPPLRRVVGILVPGLASLALVAQVYTTAYLDRGTGVGNAYLLANWGELGMAAVFAVLGCLAAATIIAGALPPEGDRVAADPAQQAAAGLLGAVAAGLTIAGLYAMTGVVLFGLPSGPFLRWTLLAAAPVAAAGTVAAVLVMRRAVPAAGWHSLLLFPPGSIVCAAAGMVAVQYALTVPRDAGNAWLLGLAGRAGGFVRGVAVALALVEQRRWQIVVAAPLAVFTAAIVSPPATGLIAVMYVAAAAFWWGRRVWRLARDRWDRPVRSGS